MSIQNQKTSFLSVDYLDMIFEHFQDGIYITDNEANTVYLNHSYERISGLQKVEVIGKNMRSLVEDGIISASGTLLVLETGESATIEQTFRMGKRAVITSTPVYEDEAERNHILMVITVVREITEIYTIRKELQRLTLLNRQYRNEIDELRNALAGNDSYIAVDAVFADLIGLVKKISAADDQPVLISGEDGVGKEKMARMIHEYSNRSSCPFLRIDFSVLPEEGMMDYLFGYTISDAGKCHMGVLESTDGGTVYMDELTNIPENIRMQILTILREGHCILRDGTMCRLNLRFLVGSRYTFEEIRDKGNVEAEILQRFSVFPMYIPPLRKRKDDIVPLADHFLRQYNRKFGTNKFFSRECYVKMLAYPWPGNVQELSVFVQRAAIISEQDEIEGQDLFFETDRQEQQPETPMKMKFDANLQQTIDSCQPMDLKQELAKIEAQYMLKAYEQYGNIRMAADNLGMDSSTFVRKRQRYEKMGYM